MAVYKRNYRAYTGPVRPSRRRWLTITRHALAEVFSSRVSTLLCVLSLTPTLVWATLIYVINSDTARLLLGLDRMPQFAIDGPFFYRMLQTQGWLALFLTAWIGPAMISPDLTNGALPLYLSRPIARAEYVAGKLLVLVLILSAVTWAPCLLLFGMEAAMSKTPWLMAHLFIARGLVLGAFLWIALVSLLALALSAWVRWRIVAMGLVVGIIFVPAGFGAAVSEVLRTKWGLLLNVPYLITLVWSRLLHVSMPPLFGIFPLSAAWLMLLGVSGFCLLLLNRRIQARQVVHG